MHAFSNDEAGLHDWDGEGELLQTPRRPHVPVALATTPASTSSVAQRSTLLDTPQQVNYDLCCMLGLFWTTHDLGYSLWCAAIVCVKGIGGLIVTPHL